MDRGRGERQAPRPRARDGDDQRATRERPLSAAEHETLPFDVELERTPPWVYVAAGLVIVVSILVAAKLLNMLVLLPFLVASSVGRRFASTATHVEVSEDGLSINDRFMPNEALRDVWIDADETEPRAVLAFGEHAEIAVLHFENRDQAKRFGGALAADRPTKVVGYRPRVVDALGSLRFVAIAAAFAATGTLWGLFVLAFFVLGAWAIVQAKQIVAGDRHFEVRSLLGIRTHAYDEVTGVDLDAGVITLAGGAEVRLPRAALRDATLASGTWLERGRTRVLEYVRERATAIASSRGGDA